MIDGLPSKMRLPEQKTDTENYSGEPLTEEENRAIRRILKTEDRMRWFWSTVRIWVMWAFAIFAAWSAVKGVFWDAIKAISGGK